MLEVQRYEAPKAPYTANGCFIHVGYLNKWFRTRRAAAQYYDQHNVHMRKLNAHNKWASDWDPVSKLRYVVRKLDREVRTIEGFGSQSAADD